jgi:hypothetical protein
MSVLARNTLYTVLEIGKTGEAEYARIIAFSHIAGVNYRVIVLT